MLMLAALPVQNQTISPDIYVDDDNTTGTADGSARSPYPTIQLAVGAASDGTSILVAAGTYAENVRVRDKSVRLMGGYVGGTSDGYAGGTAGDFATRDPDANVSHIQGDGTDSTVTLLESGATVVDGFRVTGGTRTIEHQPYCCWGGGFYIQYGAPTISNNLIEDNHTSTAAESQDEMVGGGIFAESADVSIIDNLIRDNTSGRGAGIAISSGNVVIQGNTVQDNIGSSDHGGGMFLAPVNADISYNLIVGNEIGRELGYGWGGGVIVFNVGSRAIFSYNIITDNYAPSIGSGVFIDEGATAVIEHDLIYANQCNERGGVGIYADGGYDGGSTVFINQTTIVDNDCPTSVGGNAVYVEYNSVVAISNSILWGNGWDDVIADDTSDVSATYTLSGETIEGEGNFSADPLFVDAANRDYRLSENSPAIDAGDPTAPFDAEPEPNGGRADLGAYGNTGEASGSG